MPLQALDPNAQLQVPGMMDQSAGAEAQAKLYDIGANSLGNMAQILQEHAGETAKLTGALAGAKSAIQYDANGNLLPLTKLPMDQSIASQAFRETAINIYSNTVSNQANQYARALAREPAMQADPKLFMDTWNAYQSKTLTDVDPLVAGALTPKLIEMGGNTYSDLADKLVASNKASSGLLGEQAIAEQLGMTNQRVDAMGDTKAARDIIDKTVSDSKTGVGVQLLQLNAGDPLKYNPGKLTAMAKDFYQKAYGAMTSGQAGQFGATETKQPDNTYTGDKTGFEQYIGKLRTDPQIRQQISSDADFKSMIEDPARARFAASEMGMQAQFQQDKLNADAANANNVGQLRLQGDQGMLLWNQKKDPSGIINALKQSQQTTFDGNIAIDTKARRDFQLGLIGEQFKSISSPDAVEEMRLIQGVNSPTLTGPGPRFGDYRASTQALKTLQNQWDGRYAQTTGQADGVISAYNDPAANYPFIAAPGSFTDKTGRILPRMVGEFQGGIGDNATLQQANNMYGNYLTYQATAPNELKAELTDQQRSDILLWGEAGQDKNAYVHMRSIMHGGELAAGYETRAAVMVNANKDKDFTYHSLQGALQQAFVSSSTILGAVRVGLGFAPNPNVEKLSVGQTEGWFGLSVPGGDDVRRALGYPPTGTLRIDMDQGAEKAWVDAQAKAAGTGSIGAGVFQAGLGDMFDQGYNISKMLMPAQIDVGTAGEPRDLTNDFTFGKYAPGAYNKQPEVNIAMDVSYKIADEWSKQPALREQMQGINGVLSSDFFKFGDRRYWAEQYTQGRLKLQPETGVGGRFLGYTVKGLVETPYENRWVDLNPPGQLYNFDQQNGPLAREVLKGVPEGRAAAVGMETAAGTGGAARIAATVSAAGARYTAGEIKSEFWDTGQTKSYLGNLWNTVFGGGTQPLSAPPSDVLKK